MAQKYKVVGLSGQTEVIEAEGSIGANAVFVEHYGEPAASTTLVHEASITEEDTADD